MIMIIVTRSKYKKNAKKNNYDVCPSVTYTLQIYPELFNDVDLV